MHTPIFFQGNDVETRISPSKRTSPQKYGPVTEPFVENQTRNTPVQCLNDSQKIQPKIQELKAAAPANYSGDDSIPFPTKQLQILRRN